MNVRQKKVYGALKKIVGRAAVYRDERKHGIRVKWFCGINWTARNGPVTERLPDDWEERAKAVLGPRDRYDGAAIFLSTR